MLLLFSWTQGYSAKSPGWILFKFAQNLFNAGIDAQQTFKKSLEINSHILPKNLHFPNMVGFVFWKTVSGARGSKSKLPLSHNNEQIEKHCPMYTRVVIFKIAQF